MKIIKTTYGVKIEVFDNPTESITPELTDEIFAPVNENKLKIFDTTASVEQLLENIITFYFYGPHNENNRKHIEKFQALILSSDWCTFSSKRKLLLHIINELSLLKGGQKNEFEKLLRRAMSYRNAFAHGEFSTDGRKVKMRYYEGKPMDIIIDDRYLTRIETDLNNCFDIAIGLVNKIRKESV